MYLKRLEIQGFKSVADKIELQFNPGVSAIVGPNGSGKSNIADAVRWVLGEQSAKSLRGSKMEDVIFAGSDKRKAVGMAEVSLTLDNSTAAFPLDFAEITVTRRVFRSGESEYMINKSHCRLKDIHELFMDTGIGREGYSIIGQGKIDEILSARAEDRRVIIEEAAGIVKYKVRKQQAVKKLSDTEQNMVRINDIISELETQIGPLAEQSATAREYLTYKDELDSLEVNLLINQVEDQKARLAEIDDKGEILQRRMIEAETELRNTESGIESEKFAINQLDEDITALQAEIYDTGSRIEKNEAEVMVARERTRSLESQRDSLQTEIAELLAKEAAEQNQHAGEEEALAVLQSRIAELVEELADTEGQLADTQADLADQQRHIEEKKGDIIELLNETAGVRNSLSSGEVERQNLLRRLAQLNEQEQANAGELQDIAQREKALEQSLADIDGRHKRLGAEESGLEKEIKRLAAGMETSGRELSLAKEAVQNESSLLKALSDLQKGYEGYHGGVKEVLLAGKNGTCSGISGVVAELIKVPKDYETALEVALGSALQFIITETDEAARDAIEFLKKNKSGRATFVPLSTVRPNRETNIKKYQGKKGFVGRASELLECAVQYRPAMEFLLGRTIIVENIRQATEIARQAETGLKFVTLDGDVVNPGGTITGGVYQKSGRNLLSRLRQIEEASAKIDVLEEQIGKQEGALRELRDAYESCEEALSGVRRQQQALDMEKAAAVKDLEVVRQDRERLDNMAGVLLAEKQGLAEELQKIDNQTAALSKQLAELEAQDSGLRDTISTGQEELARLDAERAELAEIVTGKKVELAGLRQEEINYAQLMKRVLETIAEIGAQVTKRQGQIADLQEQKTSMAAQIDEYQRQIRELALAKGDKEDHLNKLRNDKQALVSSIADQEAKVKKVTREMTEVTEQLHGAEVRRARCEFEVESLLAKLADQFQMTYEEALLIKTEIKNRRETTARVKELKEAIIDLGNVNIASIEEYQRVSERYSFLQEQYHDLHEAKEALYRVIAEMDQIMTKKFRESFIEINIHFGEVFSRFFGGGRAELILTNADNLLECGVDIVAQPLGKKPQHLSLLSGGEKALTAISLLFAIFKTKPSPFCVLDEIEAALDEANADRFAEYMKEFGQNVQFIVITHNKRTMEAADVLYGVTIDESSVTKLVSMRMGERKAV